MTGGHASYLLNQNSQCGNTAVLLCLSPEAEQGSEGAESITRVTELSDAWDAMFSLRRICKV